MDSFQKKFIEEAIDLINNLEEALLNLEKKPDDNELIAAVFRIMHSLKGGGGMFGFDDISHFTHNLETIYDEVRNNRLKLTEELLSVTFSAVDHLRNLLNTNALKDPLIKKNHDLLLQKVDIIQKNFETTTLSSEIASDYNEKAETAEKTYFVQFIPHENIMDNGTNPLYLIDELCSLGKAKAYPKINRIPLLSKFSPSKCYAFWEVILVTNKEINDIKGVFIFVEDESELHVIKLSDLDILSSKTIIEEFESKLLSDEKTDTKTLHAFIKEQEAKIKTQKVSVIEKLSNFTKENVISSIRVDSEKIDQLMNLVSELVTTQASLSLYVEENQVYELNQLSENIENITRQLRDTAFSISLIPIETMLTRFHRLIRDLSPKVLKQN